MPSDETFPGETQIVTAARNLTYVPADQTDADLLATLPTVPDNEDDMLVVTSLRIPLSLHRQLKAYADAHSAKPSVLIREWIELHLSATDEDRPISLADAIRALASLRPTEHRDAA